jgi:hypothetical protein
VFDLDGVNIAQLRREAAKALRLMFNECDSFSLSGERMMGTAGAKPLVKDGVNGQLGQR